MDILVPLAIMLFYTIGVSYVAYQVWWNFDTVRENLINRNESRGSLGLSANVWIKHWTYKWMVRIITLWMVLFGSIGLIGVFYEFMITLLGA